MFAAGRTGQLCWAPGCSETAHPQRRGGGHRHLCMNTSIQPSQQSHIQITPFGLFYYHDPAYITNAMLFILLKHLKQWFHTINLYCVKGNVLKWGPCLRAYVMDEEEVKRCIERKCFKVFCSGRFLFAAPGILLHNDELQDEFGCLTRPLHHHRVATVIQQVHSAPRQFLCNDCSSRDIHHLANVGQFSCLCRNETSSSIQEV